MKSADHLKLFLRTKIFKKFENLSRFELVLRQKSCEGDVCDILKILLNLKIVTNIVRLHFLSPTSM